MGDGDDDQRRRTDFDARIRDEINHAAEVSAQLVALLARCQRTLDDARAVLAAVEHREAIEDHTVRQSWTEPVNPLRKTG